MSPLTRASVPLLLAAAGLSGQTVITLNGAGGSVAHSTNYNLTNATVFGLGFEVEYLVVGGGGGGGGSGTDTTSWGGAGGGAGGLRQGSLLLSNQSYAVTVGAGGTAGPRTSSASTQVGGDGGSSSFASITALGGGGGGAYKIQGRSGGSGGGGGGRGNGENQRTAGGAGTAGQGFAGGASRDDDSIGRSAGGGGGGAGGAGGNGGTNATVGGAGGLGLASSITGTSSFYAAGGGGGAWDSNEGSSETAGTGGSGIGGNGATSGNAGSGAANTGSGGGGTGTQGTGGAGGSGIVVVRYLGDAVATGGTVAAGTGSAAGYTVHTFTSTGAAALDLTDLDRSSLGTTLSGQFSGSGALSFNPVGSAGASRFTLTGDSSAHTGSVIVNAGATVVVGDGATSGRLGTGNIFIQQGGTLVFDRSDDITVANGLRTGETLGTNAGTVVKRGAGTLTLSGVGGTANHAGLVKVEQGVVNYDASSRHGSAVVRTEIDAGATFNLVDNAVPLFGGSTELRLETSGAGRFIFSGSGRRTLSVPFPGVPALNHTSVLAHTGGTVIDGTYLNVQSLASGSDLTVRGGGEFHHNWQQAANLGDVVVESGNVYMGALAATSVEVSSGLLSASLGSSSPVVKTGSGTFILRDTSGTLSSSVRAEGGVLDLRSNRITGTVTLAGGSVQVGGAASWLVNFSSLVLDGGELLSLAAASPAKVEFASLDLQSGTVSSSLWGAGSVTKTTGGTALLAGDNTFFRGSVTVSGGTLQLGTVTSLGSASVLLEGGTIELAGTTRVGYFEQTGGTVTGGTLVSTQILTESGTLGAILADGDGFSAGILKRTAGVTEVTAANTFTGVVSIQQGTLRLAGNGAFASAARLATRQGGTFDLNGKAQTVDGIDGDGAIALGDNGTLTVSSASNSSFGGALSGNGNLVKAGAGTLTLTGASTHGGNTDVDAGTLVVNGSLGGSGTLNIASGATLGGSGTIAGTTVIDGIHSPGNSPGLQTFGSTLVYNPGAEIKWELAAQTEFESDRGLFFDAIDVTGSLLFNGNVNVLAAFALEGSTVDWTDAFWASGRTWKLFDVGGSVTGFNYLSIAAAGALDSMGQSLATVRDGAGFSLSLRSGDVFIDYIAPAPIPEPSTYGLILGGLALAGVALRRRRPSKA